MKPIIEKHMI